MNTLTEDAIDLIKRFEGFVATPYLDAVRVNSIGFGHVILPGEQFTRITAAEGDALLRRDLSRYSGYVRQYVTAPLNDNQFGALVSLTYNEGTAPLAGTLGRKLNAGDYAGAGQEFDRWVYAGGRVLKGLVARRAAERALFLQPPATTGRASPS